MFVIRNSKGQFLSNLTWRDSLEAATRYEEDKKWIEEIAKSIGGKLVHFNPPENEIPLRSERYYHGNLRSVKEVVTETYPGATHDVLPQYMFNSLLEHVGPWGSYVYLYYPDGTEGIAPLTKEAAAILCKHYPEHAETWCL